MFSRDIVIQALENPDYHWRTIEGIAKETKLSVQEVEDTLKHLEDRVIRSSFPTKDGNELFTTRRHYKKSRGFIARTLNALSGRMW